MSPWLVHLFGGSIRVALLTWALPALAALGI